jgi:copper chaperone
MKETLKIAGMSCGGCVSGVRRALARLPLIHSTVDVGRAEVEYDDTVVTHEQIVRIIKAAGYEVTGPAPMIAVS